jgi:hypothetical protein
VLMLTLVVSLNGKRIGGYCIQGDSAFDKRAMSKALVLALTTHETITTTMEVDFEREDLSNLGRYLGRHVVHVVPGEGGCVVLHIC